MAGNQFGGGIMVFLRQDIPSNLLSIEELPIEEVLYKTESCKNGFYVAPIIQIKISLNI